MIGPQRIDLKLLLASVSAGVVGYIVVADLGRTSPGELASVHGRIDELAGRSGCSECHGGFRTSMTAACLDCHETVSDQIDAGLGLHGVLDEALVESCAQCHSDHHGASFAVVNRQSFALAGIEDPDSFDHALIGFPMDGKHLELSCAECHEHADEPVLPEGAFRYIGLDRGCVTCHEDPHEGALSVDCASCHTQASFDELVAVDHERFLPLDGAHSELSCRDCHDQASPHALEVETPVRRECLDCHESPHENRFVNGVARLVSSTAKSSCATCHTSELISFRDHRVTTTPAQHAFSGFRLGVPHDDLDCASCHGETDLSFEERFPGRSAAACQLCHDDPHAGQFVGAAGQPMACLACHEEQRFLPHAFDEGRHAQTEFALDGAHASVDCEACHELGTDGETRAFRGTPTDCDRCHSDAHLGFFAELEGGDDCASCHRVHAFDEVASFDHERWTAFAVRGAHEQESCEICHPRADLPNDHGRRFGLVAEHFGEYEGCATCHADPHDGAFDSPRLPTIVRGRAGCARCHVETSFRTFPEGFDHGLWTGFSLEGEHLRVDCAACHPRIRPDDTGRSWAPASGTSCADCHTNPHAGQFRVEGVTDCSRCHQDTRSFSTLAFDHDVDSRFPLDDAHEDVSCSGCHESWPTDDGRIVVRYKPLGVDCVDCHGLSEEDMRHRGRRR